MAKAVIFFADGMEECEALLVVDLLRRAGVEVTTASIMEKKQVLSSHGIKIDADMLAEDVEYKLYDIVILPGGKVGTENLGQSALVQEQVKAFSETKRIAAICAAPSVFAKLGLLENKKATCHPSFEPHMAKAQLTHGAVAVAGNIITGQGLGAAIPFALELITELVDAKTAQKVAGDICFK